MSEIEIYLAKCLKVVTKPFITKPNLTSHPVPAPKRCFGGLALESSVNGKREVTSRRMNRRFRDYLYKTYETPNTNEPKQC